MFFNVKSLTRAAMVAAVYAALTVLLAPISFGAVQFRAAEALTVMPMFMSEAVPGLAIGCLVANILGGAMLPDIVFGSIATLLAAVVTRALRKRPLVAMAAPAAFNAIIVGPVVYFCYVMAEGAFSFGALAFTCLTVGLGELAIIYTLGFMLSRIGKRLNFLSDNVKKSS